jgi:hypothetical protein
MLSAVVIFAICRPVEQPRFLSPLSWQHLNLTGDYAWPRANHIKLGRYTPLRRSAEP